MTCCPTFFRAGERQRLLPTSANQVVRRASARHAWARDITPTFGLWVALSQNVVRDIVWPIVTAMGTTMLGLTGFWGVFLDETLTQMALSGAVMLIPTLIAFALRAKLSPETPKAQILASFIGAFFSILTWNLAAFLSVFFIFSNLNMPVAGVGLSTALLNTFASNNLAAIFTGLFEGLTQMAGAWLTLLVFNHSERLATKEYFKTFCALSSFPKSLLWWPLSSFAGADWQTVYFNVALKITNGVSDPTQMANMLATSGVGAMAAIGLSVGFTVMAWNYFMPYFLPKTISALWQACRKAPTVDAEEGRSSAVALPPGGSGDRNDVDEVADCNRMTCCRA